MANKKVTLRNVASGVRGFHTGAGYRELAPGETASEVEFDAANLKATEATGHFRFGKDAEANDTPPAAPPIPPEDEGKDEVDKMDEATMRTTIVALGGAEPAANASEDDLRKQVRDLMKAPE